MKRNMNLWKGFRILGGDDWQAIPSHRKYFGSRGYQENYEGKSI